MLRLLLSLLIGAGVGAGAVHAITGDDHLAGVWITALALTPFLGAFIGLSRSTSHLGAADPTAVEEARRAGRLAGARVLLLTRTGMSINDVSEYEAELLVDARDRSPYRTTVRELIDVPQMAACLPGSTLAVVRLGEDSPDVVVLPDEAAPPVRAGADAAAQRWDVDPDAKVPGRTRFLIPSGRRGRGLRRALFVALAAIMALAVAWPSMENLELHARSWASGQDLYSYTYSYTRGPGCAAGAVAAFTRETGVERATHAVVYGAWIRVDAPSSPGATTYDSYEVRAGRVSRVRPVAGQPQPGAEYDFGSVNWSALPELFDRAVVASEIPADQRKGHLQLVTDDRFPPYAEGDLKISVYVNGDYGNLTLTADPQGRVLEDR